jgi:hypothetical protein
LVEGTEVTNEIPLDSPEISSQQYKEARAEGKTTVDAAELDDSPKITGDETSKEFKEKRQEQLDRKTGFPRGGGFEKRIHKLTREKAELQERLARYESANGNGEGLAHFIS